MLLWVLLLNVPAVADARWWENAPLPERKCGPPGNAECRQGGSGRCVPNGGNRWCYKRNGDCYGERQPVRDAEEAKQFIKQQYEGRNLTVSPLIERRWGYEAEIRDHNGTLIDRIMLNKRSGRIRSLY